MELKYAFIIPVGALVLILLLFLRPKKKDSYAGGLKIWNLSHLEQEPYFKKKMATYRFLRTSLIICCIVALVSTFILAAQPYKKQTVEKELYSRDIILCLDISYSVDALNLELVENLKDTVSQLQGERFGIVIFNSSAVLLSPLTNNDADTDSDTLDDDWMYLSNYIIEGTLVGSEDRGSSLIGDGLATSVYDFSDLEEDRARIIIFSTDNDLQGTPIVTLGQAASLCKENNITVYGIGTSEMLDKDKETMKAAMIKTGGKFYLQEESGTVSDIVENIEKEGKSLVKGKKEIQEIPMVEVPAILLFSSVFVMFLCLKGLRR